MGVLSYFLLNVKPVFIALSSDPHMQSWGHADSQSARNTPPSFQAVLALNL